MEYKNIICGLDNKIYYFFGWQQYPQCQEVTKVEYEKSKLPILKNDNRKYIN